MNYKTFKYLIVIISIIFSQCYSTGKFCECDKLTRSKSIKYYVSGLTDHSELDPKWIVEEINKDDIYRWFKNYSTKNYSQFMRSDTTGFNKTVEISTKKYIEEWDNIKYLIQNEDKIYYYTTPEIYWKSLAGQEGITIINNCEILFVFILAQS